MDISKLVDILFSGDIKDIPFNLVKAGVQTGLEHMYVNYQLDQAIEQYLNQQNPNIKKQVEALTEEIRKDLKKQIHNKDIHLIADLSKQLDQKLQVCEFPTEIRESLKSNLILYILGIIQKIDIDFANDLDLAIEIMSERQKNEQQEVELQNLREQILIIRRALDNALQARKSPMGVAPVQPQLDDSFRIVGHEDILKQIQARYDNGSNVVFLCGRPGMGKTTLAKRYARTVCETEDVYFITYEKSIERTIGKLAKKNLKNGGKKVLSYWKEIKRERPILLIIDNFDEDALQRANGRNVEEELAGGFYQELVSLGIHILFTTRTQIERNGIEVTPVEDTLSLFENFYGRSIEGDAAKKIIEEIIEILRGNTLLIILVANIIKRFDITEKASEVLERLKNCNMREEPTEIVIYADIHDKELKTTYEQAYALLDMSGIQGNDAANAIFTNAVLLPLDGMKKQEFLELTGNQNENVLMNLINNSWILKDSCNIHLHPMIREIALQKGFVSYQLCENYCKNIREKIAIRAQFEGRLAYKNYAQEIFSVFKSDNLLNLDLIRLFYDLSDIYDELDERAHSLEIARIIENNIDLYDENPIEKAKVLSGIAYSLNNCYDSMETLDEAQRLLNQALTVMENIMDSDQYDRVECAQTRAMILSNFGSNYLAKSKCDQTKKEEYLKQALEKHRQALEIRQIQYERLLPEPKRAASMKASVATSYTTIATDYFYLSDYEQAIAKHEKALGIRKELRNNKGKSINQQRIIGCIIEMYRQRLTVGEAYIAQALSYYPQVLEINYAYKSENALKDNMRYLVELRSIVLNDRRLERFINETEEKCKEVVEWVLSDEKLKETLANDIQKLQSEFSFNRCIQKEDEEGNRGKK